MKVILAGLIFLSFVSSTAQAAVLEQYATGTATPTTIGSFAMTDLAFSGAAAITSTVASPISGSLEFKDRYGNSANMVRGTANTTSWWQNGEASDYDVFLTGEHLITIMLPVNTRAFSFNVGADVGSTGINAWLSATETGGSGVRTSWFNVNRNNTPGFGIYAGSSDCSSALTSVTIDPVFWGFGNFSINQDTCSTSVPETSSVFLFGLGLLGLLGLARRKA